MTSRETGATTGSARTIDGRRLFGRAVGFGRALRRAGLGVDLGAAIDFARSLEIVGVEDRDQVKAAGAAVFVRRKDAREPYDVTFERYWRNRFPLDPDAVLGDEWSELVPAEGEGHGEEPPLQGEERMERGEDQAGIPLPADHEESEEAGEADSLAIAPDAYSKL